MSGAQDLALRACVDSSRWRPRRARLGRACSTGQRSLCSEGAPLVHPLGGLPDRYLRVAFDRLGLCELAAVVAAGFAWTVHSASTWARRRAAAVAVCWVSARRSSAWASSRCRRGPGARAASRSSRSPSRCTSCPRQRRRLLDQFHGAHAEPQDALVERFVAQAERSHAQHTAIDRVHRQQAAALSPAELHREGDRLERLAARAPGPRLQRELAHAEERLADTQHTATAAAQRRAQVEAELHGRRRPSRDDRRELAQAQAIERDAQIAVGQAAERVHEPARPRAKRPLAGEARRRSRPPGRPCATKSTHARSARSCAPDISKSPRYLLDELGQRPDPPKARGVWDRAAVRIEHYRNSFDVSDPHSALGDRPDELRARAAHDQAQRDVDAAKARLAPTTRSTAPRPACHRARTDSAAKAAFALEATYC